MKQHCPTGTLDMSKKILVISSSPRRGGNSDTLCDQFIKGAAAAGNEAEKIFLADKNINSCIGCELCVDNPGTCSQNDDMTAIKDEMAAADVIVLASPIYFYAVCGQLKTFIDRNCFYYTLLGGKEFYYIFSVASEAEDATARAVTELGGFLACLDEPVVSGILSAAGLWHADEARTSKYMDIAYNMGQSV